MMKGRSGEVLWDDTIRLGIELRKKIRAVRREFEEKETRPERRWFFEPFVPDRVAIPDVSREGAVHNVAWETVSTDLLATDPSYWQLTPGSLWHGFPELTPGFAMTDPNKLTVLTPGFDHATGGYADHGIPAPVVAQYLRENRIVAEKNDLNSLLFLLTPGVEASKAGTLISGLVAFKKLHDDNALLEEVIPEFYQRRSARYAGVRLRDLCADMHGFFRDAGVSALQAKQFLAEHLPDIAMSPRDAARYLVRNDVDYLPIDAIARPHCHNAIRGLSARHRHDRAGRAADRTGATHDRLPQDVRNQLQYLPRLRCRDSGGLQGSRCVRPHPVAYLRGLPNEQANRNDKPGHDERPAGDSFGPRATATSRRCWRSTATISAAGSRRASTTAVRRSRMICATGARTCAISVCRIWWHVYGGEVVGYAYVVLFRKRPAYRYAVKHSIYVHHEHLGRGVGRLLMQELIDVCAASGLSADDRLYRCRQHGFACHPRKVRLLQGRAAAGRRLSIRPLGRHRHGATLSRRRFNRAATARAPLFQAMNRLAAHSQRSVLLQSAA